MFLARRPSAQDVDAFLDASHDLPLTYQPIGIARTGARGFAVDELVADVGRGDADYRRSQDALAAWKHADLGWARAVSSGSVLHGDVVAVVVSHLGFWSINGSRVVYEIGGRSQAEFGLAYGTLTNHAECGEEIFKVALDERTGAVSYTIRAASHPRAALAYMGYPIVRFLQAKFRRDSVRALTRAVHAAVSR